MSQSDTDVREEFARVLDEVRQAGQTGWVSHTLLERAYKLASTPEMEQLVEDAAYPPRPPGEFAALVAPYLWKLDGA
jgi:predicted metal-dependent HD superfamily phosphohydrolase